MRPSPVLILALAGAVSTGSLRAEALLGASSTAARMDILQFGESSLDNILGEGFRFEVSGATPVNDQVDTVLRAGYGFADGKVGPVKFDYKTTFIGTDFIFHFFPDEAVNPYLLGGPYVTRRAVDVSRSAPVSLRMLDLSDNEVGVQAGGGSEFQIYDLFLARAELRLRVDTELDVNALAQGQFGWWALPQLLASLGLSYDSDDGDRALSLLATWKLP
jgi:hypothetical protein